MDKTLLLVLSLIYGVICIVISALGAGKIKQRAANEGESFFLGGRSLGLLVSVTSVTMGVLSGLAMFGSPALVMRGGTVLVCTAGFGVMGLVYPWYGYKIWKIGKKRGYMTTADFVAGRYGSVGYSKLIAAIQLVFMIPYLTVQFVAIGNCFTYFTNISFTGIILIFSVLLIVLMLVGGAGGVGYMDVFNALLGFGVPLVVLIIAWVQNGGDMLGQLALQNDPNYMDATVGKNFWGSGLNVFTNWFSAFFAIMFSPHIIQKMLMVKDKKTFKNMTILAPVTHLLVCIPIFLNGALGIALYKPELTAAGTTDFLVQTIIADYAPDIFVLFMIWALLAFAMSTANAFTISCSTIIAHDFVAPIYVKKGLDQATVTKKSVVAGKIAVVVIVAISAVFAMGRSMFITDYAYSLATPGFAQVIPAVLFGLFWKRGCKEAAIPSTILGVLVLVFCTFIVPKPLGVHQIIWSVGINILCYMIIAFVKKPSKEIVEEFFPEE